MLRILILAARQQAVENGKSFCSQIHQLMIFPTFGQYLSTSALSSPPSNHYVVPLYGVVRIF
jgi:hypothetical protein